MSQAEVVKKASLFRRPKSAGGSHAPINQRTIGRLESPDGNPTIEIIEAVASVFQIDPWKLMTPEGIDGSVALGDIERMLIEAFPHLDESVKEIWISSARTKLDAVSRQKKVA
jgi:transcriptional regulator with XRE-family HTH domain